MQDENESMQELEEIESQPKIKSDKKVLEINNLSKSFHEVKALVDVSFSVNEGEIVGIIGANGSGKTTLFNCISGVLHPEKGEVLAKSIPSPTYSKYFKAILRSHLLVRKSQLWNALYKGDEWANIVGLKPNMILNDFGVARTFQIVRPFKFLTSIQNTTVPHVPKKLFSSPSSLKSAATRSLLEVDLGEKKNYPAVLLPHGDLKRLDFARAHAANPKILLLDEPFSGLSAEDAFRVTQLIKNANREHNTTILIVEHKLKLLKNLVERIIVFESGQIIASGTPEEISQNQRVIASYLGSEVSNIA